MTPALSAATAAPGPHPTCVALGEGFGVAAAGAGGALYSWGDAPPGAVFLFGPVGVRGRLSVPRNL